jgi:hypothetical protein
VRPARVIVVLGILLTLVGCDSDSDSEPSSDSRGGEQTAPRAEHPHGEGLRSHEGALIRHWLAALERDDYARAARSFAPGALVDQGVPYRLTSPAAARRFNAALPCRADLIRLRDEGRRSLASFRIRRGPGGPCHGTVRVRLRFRDEHFSEFVQLPGDDDDQDRSGEPI